MNTNEESLSVQAYEVWCSLSEVEKDYINKGKNYKGFCDIALDNLYLAIQTHLLSRDPNKEKNTQDTWTNIKAASCLLDNLSQCTSEKLLGYVFDLIGSTYIYILTI
jgi:hypothetical protein